MRATVCASVLLVAACSPGADPGENTFDADDYGLSWRVEREADPLGMFMSVWGTASDDVWLVGGQKGGDGFVLRGGPGALAPVALPPGTPMLNWVHGTSERDVWVGGVGGALLHWTGKEWDDHSVEEPGAIWGVHAAAPDDVLVVGGSFFNAGSPFAYHWDGEELAEVALPADLSATASIFKAHHDGDRFVVVGSRGLTLSVDDRQASRVPTDVEDDLVTVHRAGTRDPIAVGGLVEGGLWSFTGAGWSLVTEVYYRLNGVHDLGNGLAVAVGDRGYAGVWDDRADTWTEAEPQTLEILHATWVARNGDTWAVGGNFATGGPEFRGVVLFSPGPVESKGR